MSAFSDLDTRLRAALRPVAPPIAITFQTLSAASNLPRISRALAPANDHGRTGSVPAGCVFWMEAVNGTFSTVAEDHANCSVGSFTHGFISLEEAAQRDDVEAIIASGWVSPEGASGIPSVSTTPSEIVYGPLSEAVSEPDVVLCRINGLGLMTLKDSVDDVVIEGKPQCHIVALAKERAQVAASVGCALSRARTGMRSEEMTCAFPGSRLAEIIERMEKGSKLDQQMARYAADDSRRFR